MLSQAEARALGSSLPSDAVVDDNLGFAKERTISRLTEMQTLEHLINHAELHAPQLLLALKEARDIKKKKQRA